MITLSLDDEEEALLRSLSLAIDREEQDSRINKKEFPKKFKKNMMFVVRYNKLIDKIEGERV